MRKTIILEDLDFSFKPGHLNAISKHWNEGKGIDEISKIYSRHPEEILLALFHQARLGLINRPFAWRKA